MTLAAEPMTRKVLMCNERFRHLPVVSGGALIGVLSDRDILLRATLQDGRVCAPETPVGEAATVWPHVGAPDTDVCDLVRVMTEKKVDAVPVVEGTDRLVGLVTSTDLLLLLIRLDEAKIPLPFVFDLEQHPVNTGAGAS
jgi:acetoin utilization protein AcuB